MKKIETLALLAIVLVLISWFASLGAPLFIDWALGEGDDAAVASFATVRTLATVVPTLALNLAIGIWMFFFTRKHNTKSFVWLLLGMTCGLFSPVLYFSFKTYEEVTNSGQLMRQAKREQYLGHRE